jgi:DNA primase
LLLIPGISKDYEVLACYGTNGLTEEHTEVIKSLENLMEIILFFDGDRAGKEGVKRNAEIIKSIQPKVKISFVETPEGEDINSLSISHSLPRQGGEPEIFTQLLESRKEIEASSSRHGGQAVEYLSADRHEKKSGSPSLKHSTIQLLNITNPNKIAYATSTAQYQILGGLRKDLDSMRVSLTIRNHNNNLRHRSKPDLFEDKQVEKIAREAAEKRGL